eukprot:GHVN01006913.1.p1 GENE.GHVN01006913.1~~GHVN01006913.1.p1  ORF type:complete len:739 (-),score=136.93 GHVN01006913.1:59-2275(-)
MYPRGASTYSSWASQQPVPSRTLSTHLTQPHSSEDVPSVELPYPSHTSDTYLPTSLDNTSPTNNHASPSLSHSRATEPLPPIKAQTTALYQLPNIANTHPGPRTSDPPSRMDNLGGAPTSYTSRYEPGMGNPPSTSLASGPRSSQLGSPWPTKPSRGLSALCAAGGGARLDYSTGGEGYDGEAVSGLTGSAVSGGRSSKTGDGGLSPLDAGNGGEVSELKFVAPEDFENMVGDLRRTFIGWLKKTESELRRECDRLNIERREFEEELRRSKKQFLTEKQHEFEKIKEERRKAEVEVSTGMRQLRVEREDARRKINEEKQKFDADKDSQRRRMLLEREKLIQEQSLFDSEKKRVVDTSIAAETMVEINVGGIVFETSRHTLTQQKGSFLEGLLSGRHHVSRDRQGHIFLDRDSELFRTLLNFLRNSQTPPVPRDATESEVICKEAKFYGIRFYPFPLVFAVGGHSGEEHLRAVEVLDVGQQCWRPCRPLTTERAYFGGSVLNNRLFVYGGQNLDYKALCEVEVYDCLRDTWMPGASLNVPRRNTCGAVLGERVFAVGGFDGSSILSSVEVYDPRMKNWMEVAPMTTPRSSAMCCTQDDKVLVLGGTRGDRLRTVEMYDERMNQWEPLSADMIETRSAGCATSCLRHIYAMGGIDGQHTVHASLEVLDPETLRWAFRKSMLNPCMDAACVPVSDSIMVGGGQHGEVLSSTSFYRPELDEWQPGPAMLVPRYGHAFLQANL